MKLNDTRNSNTFKLKKNLEIYRTNLKLSISRQLSDKMVINELTVQPNSSCTVYTSICLRNTNRKTKKKVYSWKIKKFISYVLFEK